jgi:antitoxin component YwqK of YwqJK toxin-antitoxin module
MRKTLLCGLLLLGAFALWGQNLLDEQGRKTGHWKVEHPNGNTLYEADFVEGVPVGEMIRYYKSGAVQARMMFDASGERSYTQMFYPNRDLAAEGWFVRQQKDSVWTYYSSTDGSVRIREPYTEGKLQGMVRFYYNSGKVSQEIEWENNEKQGIWKQYYPSGSLRLSAHYRNNRLFDSYDVYYANGKPEVKGEFLDNQFHGLWSYFDEAGEELISLEYLNGIPLDREKYNQLLQDTLQKYLEPIAPESFEFFE